MFRVLRRKKEKITYDEYIGTLQQCSNVAEKEALRMDERLVAIKELLKESKIELEDFIKEATNLGQFEDEELLNLLYSLNNKIDERLNVGISDIEQSIKKKKENLKSFTVTLFGRTKAGKSTLREALTNGNGDSIGKGAQRTTRDIKEYTWNNLRIIDTPGIAAYNGQEDVKIAESVINETDVILFLVTNDSVQQSEFEKLIELRTQNKPIVILLNVKEDIEDEFDREDFLEECDNIVSLEGQKGNVDRIKGYCKQYLGTDKIEIIPIHAMAAYESIRTNDEQLKKQLYNASKINKVKYMLREMIINQGKQKRIQTFRDDFIYYLNSLESIFWNSYKEIRPRIQYIKTKHNEIKGWFNQFKIKGSNEIDSEVSKIYAELISKVDDFVDNYAGNNQAEVVWNNKLKEFQLEKKLKKIYEDLLEEAERYLNEFQRQMNFDINSFNFSGELDDIGDLKKGVLGRVARWGAAVLDVAAVPIILNLWNPAGWIAGIIGVGAVVLSLFSWVWGDDSKRYDKRKSEIKADMKKHIRKQQKETIIQLKKSFKNNIVNYLEYQIDKKLNNSIEVLYNYVSKIKDIAIQIREEQNFENKQLFKEIYECTFEEFYSGNMLEIAREQGSMMKILTHENVILKDNKNRSMLESIIGERIIYVEFTNEIDELIKRSIFPARPDNLQVEIFNKEITIKVDNRFVGQILGRNKMNIRLTKRILSNFRINVMEV